jgi:hypothetical protein
MVTRKIEIGTDIPADWVAYRAQVRLDCAMNKDLITQAADIDAFIAVVSNLKWPLQPGATRG